jgi:hypothetical protein
MNEKYIKRLTNEWLTHKKIIIAVDFDDTISPWKFNSEDDLAFYEYIIEQLIYSKNVGAYIIVFTACDPNRYDDIINYCKSKGLIIDGINKTPVDLPYGKEGSKIYANIFLDDRGGLDEALNILQKSRENVFEQTQALNIQQVEF